MYKGKYQKLFESIKIKDVEIKNRIVMAPMATRFATFNGEVTPRLIRYYVERTKGGAGLINIEATAISREGIGWNNNLAIYDDHYIEGLKKLTEAVHANGAKISLEIFHTGSKAPRDIIGQLPVAPSAVYQNGEVTPRELTVPEIKELVKKYGDAAQRAKEAGFDIVNIHMAHGYLINQFLSPMTNKRTDEYGGSVENRVRFGIEIIKEVRKRVGDNYPIFCRLTAEEGVGEIGIDLNESIKITPLLEKAGADVIDISAGSSGKPFLTEGTYSLEQGFNTYLAEGIKKVVNIPITIVGKIRKADMAEKILADGIADFIVLGRTFIADPYWPNKVYEGREDEIRPCISCVQGCTGRLGKDLDISCTVNPEIGREGMFDACCNTKSYRVLVIGGGIGGMNVANELAKKGHKVVLAEKKTRLGGQANLAIVPRHKTADLEPLLDFLKLQLKLNNVEIHTGVEITPDNIQKYNPDIIVQATGAQPRCLDMIEIKDANVLTAWEVLENKDCPGKNIAIIGAGEVGLETTEFLVSELGKNVFVFEILPEYGRDMNQHEKLFLLKRLENTNIEIFTQTSVKKVEKGKVYFQRGGLDEVVEPIDTVVFATGSVCCLKDNFKDIKIPIYHVGDCIKPGRMYEAFHSGYMVSREI